MSEHSHDTKKEAAKYYKIYGVLIVLTVVTVGLNSIKMGVVLGVIIALIVASLKASLVGSIFMHLISEQKIIGWLVWLTLPMFVMMIALIWISYHDDINGTVNLNKAYTADKANHAIQTDESHSPQGAHH